MSKTVSRAGKCLFFKAQFSKGGLYIYIVLNYIFVLNNAVFNLAWETHVVTIADTLLSAETSQSVKHKQPISSHGGHLSLRSTA